MPEVILKNQATVWVDENSWTSPDGKVTIHTIKLEGEDGPSLYSTMSKAIATVGWKGDIELYTNAKGKEYVRQAPKEESAGYQPKDNPAISAAMVVKLAFQAFISAESMLPQKPEHWAKINAMASELFKSIDLVQHPLQTHVEQVKAVFEPDPEYTDEAIAESMSRL